jgi:tyrosinase
MLRLTAAAVAAAVIPVQPAGGQATPIRVRKNARSLSPSEKRAFVNAVRAIKARPSPWTPGLSVYDQFTTWHRDAFRCDLMAAHMGPAFPPWHRMFLLLLEQELQKVDPSVMVPYWDWTVDNSPASFLWQDDFMGPDGDAADNYAVKSGPFRKGEWELSVFDVKDADRFPYLIRAIGTDRSAPDLPSAADVELGMQLPTYDTAPWDQTSDPSISFRNYLEGWRDCVHTECDNGLDCPGSHDMHNRVHLWVAGEFGPDDSIEGTMAADSSPNDPVFYLHHANIDRIWAEWQRRHGRDVYRPITGGPRGHNLNDPMWPYSTIGLTITPRMMLDHRALGYIYEGEPLPSPAPAPIQIPRAS